jgi:hypothetical protein
MAVLMPSCDHVIPLQYGEALLCIGLFFSFLKQTRLHRSPPAFAIRDLDPARRQAARNKEDTATSGSGQTDPLWISKRTQFLILGAGPAADFSTWRKPSSGTFQLICA